MSGLTNNQLEKISKKYLGKNFLGVYPCDAIPKIKKIKQNMCMIFNLSKHNEPGSHYVAIIFTAGCIYYFDSYGKILNNPYIKYFLKNLTRKTFYHTAKIQPTNSIFCGFYCLAYLIFVSKHYTSSFKPFFNMFNIPPNKTNDRIVTQYILKNKPVKM